MRRAEYRRQPQRLGAGAAVMITLAVSVVVFAAVTRWGLDLYGPWLLDIGHEIKAWLRDPRWGS
jgi:hypothetical protein